MKNNPGKDNKNFLPGRDEEFSEEELSAAEFYADMEDKLPMFRNTIARPDTEIYYPSKFLLKKPENKPSRKIGYYLRPVLTAAAMLLLVIQFYNRYNLPVVNEQATAFQSGSFQENPDETYMPTASISMDAPSQQVAISNPIQVQNNQTSHFSNKAGNTEASSVSESQNSEGVMAVQEENATSVREITVMNSSRQEVQNAISLMKQKTNGYRDAVLAAPASKDYLEARNKTVIIPEESHALALKEQKVDDKEKDGSILSGLAGLFGNVLNIEKQEKEDGKYYALTLETSKFRIQRKIRTK